jgi:RNA polymerase sigma factor (sigma-70 family)
MQLTIDCPVVDRDAELREALRRRDATAAECLVSTFGERASPGDRHHRQPAGCRRSRAGRVLERGPEHRRVPGGAARGSWIYRITVNAANQRRRSRSRRRGDVPLDEILPSFHEDGRHVEPILDWSIEIDDPAVQSELRGVLTSALEELPDHYRAVIVLHDVEGLSMAEVADCLNATVPTAKSRVHRARLVLRKRLRGVHVRRTILCRDGLLRPIGLSRLLKGGQHDPGR